MTRTLVAALAAGWIVTQMPSSAAAEGEPGFDLLGTWYLLIHYRDEATANPDADRWDERVWKFEPSGSRIKWTEYPIVVFIDSTGRFENLGTNRARRILHAWEPNAGQYAQIQSGLEINSRGSKTKTLRRVGDGYESVGGLRVASASVIGYHETWKISGLARLPVFTRDDIMGSARAEQIEGRTRYSTLEVGSGGDLLEGEFQRDASRSGTFRLMRSGDVDSVGSKTAQTERLRQHFGSRFQLFSFGSSTERLRELAEQDELSSQERIELRREIRQMIEQSMGDADEKPRDERAAIESITRQIEHLFVDEGKSFDEVEQMLLRGKIKP